MRTEIKPNKKDHLLIFFLFVLGIMLAVWGITVPDVELYVKVSFAIAIPFWIYYARKTIAKINEPVIVLTNKSIQILDENRYHFFAWAEIIDYDVSYERTSDRVEYSLKLVTKTETRVFNINGINRTPEELRKLINAIRL